MGEVAMGDIPMAAVRMKLKAMERAIPMVAVRMKMEAMVMAMPMVAVRVKLKAMVTAIPMVTVAVAVRATQMVAATAEAGMKAVVMAQQRS